MNWKNIIPSKKHIRYGFISLVIFVIIAPIIYCFSDIASFLFGETQKQNGEFFKVLVTILGGLLVLWGLYLNYRRTKILEIQTNNQADQIKAFVKQNDITEKGKVDERFKNAIEHLGNDKDAIVLGGIYALHRIAEEDKSYRKTVFDILCSYIREKTSTLKDWSDYSIDERTTIKPAIVIQTIIDLLFKCRGSEYYIYTNFRANLCGIRCINANFDNVNMDGVDLSESHLEGATLIKAKLKQAKLYEAHLEFAILINSHLEDASIIRSYLNDAKLLEAHLEGAYLSKSNLKGANLSKAFLQGAHLGGIHLENAKLIEANLRGASLRDTHLEGALLSKAFMEGVHLNNAHLENAILCSANMVGAFLNYAHLAGANLRDAHLEGANLVETHLEGANLRETHLEGAILSLAYLEGSNLQSTHIEGANLKNAHLESVNSFKMTSLEFCDYLKSRIGIKSEYSNVHSGKLSEENASRIIDEFSLNIKINDLINDLKNRLRKAQNRETNIEKDAILGVLTNERAEGIIERYNKAMADVPKR